MRQRCINSNRIGVETLRGAANLNNRRPRGRPKTFENEAAFRAAVGILLGEGMGSLSLLEVARRVGTTHQALRQRFQSRDGFVLSLLEWLRGIAIEEIGSIIASTPSPLEAARQIWTLPVSGRIVDLGEPGKQVAWFFLTLELNRDAAIAAERPLGSIDGQSPFIELILAAQAAGELIAADPEEIDEAVGVAVTGAAVQWSLNPNEPLLDKMIRCRERALAPYLTTSGRSSGQPTQT